MISPFAYALPYCQKSTATLDSFIPEQELSQVDTGITGRIQLCEIVTALC